MRQMALEMGARIERGYATVVDDEGVNYRDIAETMTIMGHRMNHSSARNYVLRVMKRFVDAYAQINGLTLSDEQVSEIAKSPTFQHGVADLLHIVEARRRCLIDMDQERAA